MTSQPLRRVFKVVNGGTPTADEENWNGDVAWATPVDLGASGRFISSTARTLSMRGLKNGSAAVPAGSVILSTRAPIGYVAINVTEMAFNQGCKALVATAPVDIRYFAYQLEAQRAQLAALGQGSTFQELSTDALLAHRVRIPELAEQRRVADYLDGACADIEELVLLRARQAALLQEKADSVMLTSLLAEGTRVSSDGDLVGLIPRGWSVGRLKDVATRVDVGIAEAATHAYADAGVPLIRSTNIRRRNLDTSDLLHITNAFALRNRAKTVHAGDILTVRTGNPGVSAVVPDFLDGCQTFTQLITTVDQSHSAEYFCAWLNAGYARNYFTSFAWGSAQRNISVPILANAPVLIPPKQDQLTALRRLEDEMAPVETARALLTQSIALLRERQQALITAAVSGQLDVTTAGQVA